MKLIIDAMGGDNAPLAVLQGSAMAVEDYGAELILVGDRALLEKTAATHKIPLKNIEFVHAPRSIPVEEEPTEIMKGYRDCSMAKGLDLLTEGAGGAFVSAGSTGALVVASTLIVKRIRGVKRAAIATLIPNAGEGYLLVDAGANHECRPEMLLQFALMGSAYMNRIQGLAKPRVGLVNIGEEETKGLELQVGAYQLLKKAPIHFIGNVEARGLPLGECDVAVADGFVGNVILKTTEGMGKFFSHELGGMVKGFPGVLGLPFLAGKLSQLRRKSDYGRAGGAPLLGLLQPVIKAHGSSDASAIKHAIYQAKRCCEQDVTGEIARSLAAFQGQEE